MLSSIIIGGDTDLVRYLRQVCAEFADICIYKILNTTSRRYEVAGVLNAYTPDVVFLDVSELDSPDSLARACLHELLPLHPQTAVVPFSTHARAVTAVVDPALAVGPTLTPPFNAEQLERAVREALRRSSTTSRVSKVMALLPSKPGAGSTTVALNFARTAAEQYGQKTLVIEADLTSGAIAYLLNLQSTTFVGDAIDNRMLKPDDWSRIVSRSHSLDILPACGAPHTFKGSRWDFYRLLKVARSEYDLVVVDLPAAIDDIAESMIAEADKVLMVTTSEFPSLSMVRRRLWELEGRGVRHRHLQLVVNRHSAGDPETHAMAAIAKHEVSALLPDDPPSLRNATRLNTLVDAKSRFGRSMVPFTAQLLGLEAPAASPLALINRFVTQAFGKMPDGAIQQPAQSRLEANSDYYHSGGGRQLDRW